MTTSRRSHFTLTFPEDWLSRRSRNVFTVPLRTSSLGTTRLTFDAPSAGRLAFVRALCYNGKTATHHNYERYKVKFELTISLGNDAMKDENDLADAIRRVAESVANFSITPGSTIIGGTTRDENGNKVGTWFVQ